MKKLADYNPTRFIAGTFHYDADKAERAVRFIRCLNHTKGIWSGKPFELLPWQEQIIRDIFGTIKPNGYRQFNTAYVEVPKKNGKSELAAAVALYLLCGDNEERATVSKRLLSSMSPPIWLGCALLSISVAKSLIRQRG